MNLAVWNEIEEGADDTAHGMLAPIAGRGEKAKELNQWMQGLGTARETAERKRLFYVACTRAREELHLFAAPERSSKGMVLPGSNNLLKAAWPAAEKHFDATPPPQLGVNVLPFALPPKAADESLTLAATAEIAVERPATVERYPVGFDPAERFRTITPLVPVDTTERSGRPHFERPGLYRFRR